MPVVVPPLVLVELAALLVSVDAVCDVPLVDWLAACCAALSAAQGSQVADEFDAELIDMMVSV